jgi:hypothetical protein
MCRFVLVLMALRPDNNSAGMQQTHVQMLMLSVQLCGRLAMQRHVMFIVLNVSNAEVCLLPIAAV